MHTRHTCRDRDAVAPIARDDSDHRPYRAPDYVAFENNTTSGNPLKWESQVSSCAR